MVKLKCYFTCLHDKWGIKRTTLSLTHFPKPTPETKYFPDRKHTALGHRHAPGPWHAGKGRCQPAITGSSSNTALHRSRPQCKARGGRCFHDKNRINVMESRDCVSERESSCTRARRHTRTNAAVLYNNSTVILCYMASTSSE